MGCRKDGTCFPMEMGMSQMKIGERTFTIGCIRDISERNAYTEALEHRALHDELTGLPNRALFADRLERAISYAERADEPRSVLVADLDQFREVNETLGRQTGDALLQRSPSGFAARCADRTPSHGWEATSSASSPPATSDVEAASGIAWKLPEAFKQPVPHRGHVIDVRASIGIAFFPQHGRESADLLRRADQAMRQAKRSGEGIAVIVAEAGDQTERRLSVLSELRDGIPRGELVLHFQPKVDLKAVRRTIGVEALVRWQHPTEGLLPPAKFMPEAERSELIEPLTQWVLENALHQQRLWSDAGHRPDDGGEHLGAKPDARQRPSERRRGARPATWGIRPGKLILELTETAIIDADAPVVLDLLHAMGGTWRSTTSGPVTHRSSTFSGCRSIRSRSTDRS